MTGTEEFAGRPVSGTDHAVQSLLAFAIGGVAMLDGIAPCLRYRRAGEGYAATRSACGRLLAIDDGVRIGFTLPSGASAEFVEMRLPVQGGRYRIVGLSLGGRPVADLAARVMMAGDEPACPDDASIRFASDAHAPLVELDVRGLLVEDGAGEGTSGTELEVLVQREDAVAVDVAILRRAVEALAAEQHAVLLAQGDALFALRREQRLHADAQTQRDVRQDDAQARMVDQLHSLHADSAALLSELRASVEEARERDTRVAQRGSDAEALGARLAGSADALAEALARQRDEVAALREDVSRLTASIERGFWRRVARRLGGSTR